MPIDVSLQEVVNFLSVNSLVSLFPLMTVYALGLSAICGFIMSVFFIGLTLPWMLHKKDWQFAKITLNIMQLVSAPIICGIFAYVLTQQLKLDFNILKMMDSMIPVFFKNIPLDLIGLAWILQSLIIIYQTLMKSKYCEKI